MKLLSTLSLASINECHEGLEITASVSVLVEVARVCLIWRNPGEGECSIHPAVYKVRCSGVLYGSREEVHRQ